MVPKPRTLTQIPPSPKGARQKQFTRRGFIRDATRAGAGFALAAALPFCSREQPQKVLHTLMRCYNYKNKTLRVYVENSTGSREFSLKSSQLRLNGANTEPLAYFCTNSGHLFWVTADMLYIRRISLEKGKLEVSKVLESRHTKPPEYAVLGVRVVSADLWRNPDAPQEEITLATLTNTGLFQAARFSLEDFVNNTPDRGIIDLAKKIEGVERWPAEGVKSGSVKILGNESFAVIPVGKRGGGNVHVFYMIGLAGKNGALFAGRKADIETKYPLSGHPELNNIIEMSSPVRYDKSLGGWIVNLIAETENGKTIPIFPIVTRFP